MEKNDLLKPNKYLSIWGKIWVPNLPWMIPAIWNQFLSYYCAQMEIGYLTMEHEWPCSHKHLFESVLSDLLSYKFGQAQQQ